jgi:hypothetical protein
MPQNFISSNAGNLARIFITGLCVGGLPAGASNLYVDFNKSGVPLKSAAEMANLREPTKNPQVTHLPVFDKATFEALAARGYVQIGMSDFTGANKVTDSMMARAAALKCGADAVFIVDMYHHSEEGAGAVPRYTPGVNLTTTTSGNVSAYRSRGTAYGTFGSTTQTTSPGTVSVDYVPRSFHHVRHVGVFYRLKKGARQ